MLLFGLACTQPAGPGTESIATTSMPLDSTTSAGSPPVSDAEACPITMPNDSTPPGEDPATSSNFHGNEELWVDLYPEWFALAVPNDYVNADGSIDLKFPWWRGVEGELAIEGHRVDAPEVTLSAEIPRGYGLTGFQASGILFPTEGCWEVTGRVLDPESRATVGKLTFVMFLKRG